MQLSKESILRKAGLRNTQPRQIVLRALDALQSATPRDIEMWVHEHAAAVNTVTVYRVLEALEKHYLLHRHSDGRVSLCTMPETHGHHALLRCSECGGVSEFHDELICKAVSTQAEASDFSIATHTTQILGICPKCK